MSATDPPWFGNLAQIQEADGLAAHRDHLMAERDKAIAENYVKDAAIRRAAAFIRVNGQALEDVGARLEDARAIVRELEEALEREGGPQVLRS